MRNTTIALFLALSCMPGSAQAQSAFGTWRGVWAIDEKFIGADIPYGSPPYEPIDIELVIHPFDSTEGRFGVLNLPASTPGEYLFGGNITALSQNGNDVTLTVFSPTEGEPTGYADLSAVITGGRLQGVFNDRSPASSPWVHYRGTIDLARVVPEPATGVLLAVAGGLFMLRRWKTKLLPGI